MGRSPAIGWDLGGAHLKAAFLEPSGAAVRVVQVACPLWQGLTHLEAALDQAIAILGSAPLHAVTMTGEMVDLFPDRAEGVRRILEAVSAKVPRAALRVFAAGRGFLDPLEAAGASREVASANWMASAALTSNLLDAALLLDIGSTTTDLVPVSGGRVLARGSDDAGRLVAGELVYTGVVRTPLMTLAEAVPFAGEWVPLMAEHFATTADIYRLTGRLPEGADLLPAADGGEKTVPGSARRLARMIGRDTESAPLASWRRLAAWLERAHLRRFEDALDRLESRDVIPTDAPVVAAGVGRFIAGELARRRGRPCRDFASLLPSGSAPPERVTDCAPAVAVAWLAQQVSA